MEVRLSEEEHLGSQSTSRARATENGTPPATEIEAYKRTAPEYPGRGYSRSRPLKGKRACWVSSPSLSYALPGPAVKGPMDKRSPTNASADRFLPYSGITCMVAVPGTGPGI